MPDETFEIIEKLYKKGIKFCPASGRQLPNLLKMFEPVLDKIAIIAENGGLAWYNGKIIYSNPTPADQVAYALKIVGRESGLYPLLSCTDCAYYDSDYAPFIQTVERSYSSSQRLTPERVIGNKTVYKISVWDGSPPAAEHGGPLLSEKIVGLRTMISGYDWLDISVSTANKGRALQALLSDFSVDKSECMAFGDHMNDLEMLQTSGQAFVPANAYEGLKVHFQNVIPSNAENGVIRKLKELL